MTELELRNLVVATAKKWLGSNEGSAQHKEIIDIYNAHKPLARSYPVKYTDDWCATFVSSVAIQCGLTDIMPTECSCGKMVTLYSKLGRWEEDDAYKPQIGDVIMYYWNDKGTGDAVGWPDHVGIVASVIGNSMAIIEGNRNNSVGYRIVKVNGSLIRGYCLPDYASKADGYVPPVVDTTKEDTPAASDAYKPTVLEWQKAAIADGFSLPKYGADGVWGNECASVAKKAIVMKRGAYKYKNLTRIVQKVVGVTADGLCGANTDAAIRAYQKANGLTADGQVGINTWIKILGV